MSVITHIIAVAVSHKREPWSFLLDQLVVPVVGGINEKGRLLASISWNLGHIRSEAQRVITPRTTTVNNSIWIPAMPLQLSVYGSWSFHLMIGSDRQRYDRKERPSPEPETEITVALSLLCHGIGRRNSDRVEV